MTDPRTRQAQAVLMSTADETEASFYEPCSKAMWNA